MGISMVRVTASDFVDLPAAAVFDYITDYRRMNEWVFGISKMVPVGDLDYGMGAIFEGVVNLGPTTLKSTAQITGWEQNSLIAFDSLSGFDFRSTVRLTAQGPNRTGLDVELAYEIGSGLPGRALARSLEPVIVMAGDHSVNKLKRACLEAATEVASRPGDGIERLAAPQT